MIGTADATESRGPLHEIALSAGPLEYRERGTGPVVVFVHGFAVNGNLWRKVVPELAQSFRCITPDLPLGAHRKPMHADADLTPGGVATLVAEFLDRLDLRDVVLVGNDTGGAICQLVITRHPARIGQLVLTPCDAFENFLPWLFKYLEWGARVPWLLKLGFQPLRWRPLRRLPFAFGLLTKRPIDDWVSDEYVHRILDHADVFRDAIKLLRGINWRDTVAAAEQFGEFTKPVLLVWPPDNPQFTWAFAERLARAFPRARLEPVEDSYTFVSEDQPQRLAELIAKHCAGA